MRRLLSLLIVAVVCLAAASDKVIMIDGREVVLGKRIAKGLTPPVEVKITGVYEAVRVSSEAECTVLRGYLVSHLAGKNYEVQVVFQKLISRTRTAISVSQEKTFPHPKPEKRIPWMIMMRGGMNKKTHHIIVNVHIRMLDDTD